MSLLGQTRKSGDAILTSVLPSTADIHRRGGHVPKVPRVDIREMKESANWQDGRPPDGRGVALCRVSEIASRCGQR